jgi:hypothetical protein
MCVRDGRREGRKGGREGGRDGKRKEGRKVDANVGWMKRKRRSMVEMERM